MSSHLATAAIVHPDDLETEPLMVAFAQALAQRGIPIGGLVQRNSPNPNGGKRHMDLIDVCTQESFRISQDLGKGAVSCTLNANSLAAASEVLRHAIAQHPDLIFINRFGDQEIGGRGFASELGQIASDGIPLAILVAERHKQAWLDYTGGSGVLLPPETQALDRWFVGASTARAHAHQPVLEATIAVIEKLLGAGLDGLSVDRAVMGPFFTGVKLSNGTGGAAFTPPKPVVRSTDLQALPPAMSRAGRLKGRPVRAFLDEIREDTGIARAFGVATLNALAETCWQRFPHPAWQVDVGVDALTAAQVKPGEKVVMVGAFVGYIRRLMAQAQPLTVLELNPASLTPEQMAIYRPADQAPQAVPGADVLLMTGSTITNDTIDDLLALADAETRVAMIGPSVPLLPDVLEARGADVLATIRITDPDHFLDVLAGGGGGQHTYDGAAELVVLRPRD